MATNPIQTDTVYLSNNSVGTSFGEDLTVSYVYPLAFDTSAHGLSASAITSWLGPMRHSGHIVDFFLGVTRPALSASGFISGTVDAAVYVNSAQVLSTNPSIPMLAASAAQYLDYATNAGATSAVSAVVNTNSAFFGPGDMISYTYNARSVGSGAAGTAGTGLRLGLVIRYFAF